MEIFCSLNTDDSPTKLVASYDMAWQRRSNGRTYNSLSGYYGHTVVRIMHVNINYSDDMPSHTFHYSLIKTELFLHKILS